MSTLTIGRAAQASGVSIDTLRFWEREGLIAPAQRSAGGYRLYGEDAIARLRFIRRAKQLGFQLPEIRELLALNDGGGARAEVKRLATHRVAELQRRIDELTRMRDLLAALAASCSGRGDVAGCPIVEALAPGRPSPSHRKRP